MGFTEDMRYEVMVDTWLAAIKEYLSVDAAKNDWTFAWKLDDHSIVKILRSSTQALLLKTVIVGKAVRCLAI